MAPTNPGQSKLCKAQDKLVDTIAESPRFQAWVGAGDATAAKVFIHVQAVNDATGTTDEHTESDWGDKFPMCVIETPENAIEWNHTSDEGARGFIQNISLQVRFEDVPTSSPIEDAIRLFEDTVHLIFEEVVQPASPLGKFAISESTHSELNLVDDDVEGGTNRFAIWFGVTSQGGEAS